MGVIPLRVRTVSGYGAGTAISASLLSTAWRASWRYGNGANRAAIFIVEHNDFRF